ncbi:MAG: hypothetical protein LBU15_01010 [Rickettsiales bacterium]|jgi:hypothetical protein|nr:hypothetical protein [Rickettsiales bacterium]
MSNNKSITIALLAITIGALPLASFAQETGNEKTEAAAADATSEFVDGQQIEGEGWLESALGSYQKNPIRGPGGGASLENSGRGNEVRKGLFGAPSRVESVGRCQKYIYIYNLGGKRETVKIISCFTKEGTSCEEIFLNGKLLPGGCNIPGVGFYEGRFVTDASRDSGKPWGRGELRYSDGKVYEGDFKNGRPNGKGDMTFVNGDIYRGDFNGGQPRSGWGSIKFSDGGIYRGLVKDGVPHHTQLNLRTVSSWLKTFSALRTVSSWLKTFSASWIPGLGKLPGEGEYIFSDGSVAIQGEWNNGKLVNGQSIAENGTVLGEIGRENENLTFDVLNGSEKIVSDDGKCTARFLNGRLIGGGGCPKNGYFRKGGNILKIVDDANAWKLAEERSLRRELMEEKVKSYLAEPFREMKTSVDDESRVENRGRGESTRRSYFGDRTRVTARGDYSIYYYGTPEDGWNVEIGSRVLADGTNCERVEHNGKTLSSHCEDPQGGSFEGNFDTDRWEGVHRFANGDVCEGELKVSQQGQPNQPSGRGTIKFSDGDSYVGSFKDGVPHTQPDSLLSQILDLGKPRKGEYRFNDGSVQQGEWNNGKLVNGQFIAKNGTVLEEIGRRNRAPKASSGPESGCPGGSHCVKGNPMEDAVRNYLANPIIDLGSHTGDRPEENYGRGNQAREEYFGNATIATWVPNDRCLDRRYESGDRGWTVFISSCASDRGINCERVVFNWNEISSQCLVSGLGFYEGDFNSKGRIGGFSTWEKGTLTLLNGTVISGKFKDATFIYAEDGNVWKVARDEKGDPHIREVVPGMSSYLREPLGKGTSPEDSGRGNDARMRHFGVEPSSTGSPGAACRKYVYDVHEQVDEKKVDGLLKITSCARADGTNCENIEYNGKTLSSRCESPQWGSYEVDFLEHDPTLSFFGHSFTFSKRSGQPLGRGVSTYPNGDVQEVPFGNGSPKDGEGVYRFANGDVYNGELKVGQQGQPTQPSGWGILIFANGASYEGPFKDGLPDESDAYFSLIPWLGGFIYKGTYTYGGGQYRGTWKKGVLVDGQFRAKDGTVQKKVTNGNLPLGLLDGLGKITSDDGKCTAGFLNGRLIGDANCPDRDFFAQGGNIFRLENKDEDAQMIIVERDLAMQKIKDYLARPLRELKTSSDARSQNYGRGETARNSHLGGAASTTEIMESCRLDNYGAEEMGWTAGITSCALDDGTSCETLVYNGHVLSSHCEIPRLGSYEGDFSTSSARPEGKGSLKLLNGDLYEGEFRNGLPEGEGKLTQSNGNEYRGLWKNGLKGGSGTFTYGAGAGVKAGLKIEGIWSRGQLNGRGTVEYPDPWVGRCSDVKFRNGALLEGRNCSGDTGTKKKVLKGYDEVLEMEQMPGDPNIHIVSVYRYVENRGSAKISTPKRLSNGSFRILERIEEEVSSKHLHLGQLMAESDGADYSSSYYESFMGPVLARKVMLLDSGSKNDISYSSAKSIYFPVTAEGAVDNSLTVDYNALNRLLSDGKIKGLNDLFTKGVVSGNSIEKFKDLKDYADALLLDSWAADKTGGTGFRCQSTILSNLVILANLDDVDLLRKLRFQTMNSSGHLSAANATDESETSPYRSVASLMGSLGIDDNNLGKVDEKYIFTTLLSLTTIEGDYDTLSLIINMENLKSILKGGKKMGDIVIDPSGALMVDGEPNDTKLFYAYDGAGFLAANPAYRNLMAKKEWNEGDDSSSSEDIGGLGRIGANLVRHLLNRDQYKLPQTWLQDVSLIIAASKDEEWMDEIFSPDNKNEISTEQSDSDSDGEKTAESILRKKIETTSKTLLSGAVRGKLGEELEKNSEGARGYSYGCGKHPGDNLKIAGDSNYVDLDDDTWDDLR